MLIGTSAVDSLYSLLSGIEAEGIGNHVIDANGNTYLIDAILQSGNGQLLSSQFQWDGNSTLTYMGADGTLATSPFYTVTQ